MEIPDNLLYKAWRFLGYWARERLGAMKTSVDEDKTILEGLEKVIEMSFCVFECFFFSEVSIQWRIIFGPFS